MNKSTYAIIIIGVLLVGLIWIYYEFELPNRSNLEDSFSNVSISTKFKNSFVISQIIIQNEEFIELNISINYEKINLKKGNYTFITKNKPGQNFYTTKIEREIKQPTERVDLHLEEPKPLKVTHQENNSIIQVNLESENYKNVVYCLDNSFSYIFIETQNEKTEIEEYKSQKCYKLDKSLKNSNETIFISYQTFGTPSYNDYINITIMDSDYLDGTYLTHKDNKDLWGETKIVKLK